MRNRLVSAHTRSKIANNYWNSWRSRNSRTKIVTVWKLNNTQLAFCCLWTTNELDIVDPEQGFCLVDYCWNCCCCCCGWSPFFPQRKIWLWGGWFISDFALKMVWCILAKKNSKSDVALTLWSAPAVCTCLFKILCTSERLSNFISVEHHFVSWKPDYRLCIDPFFFRASAARWLSPSRPSASAGTCTAWQLRGFIYGFMFLVYIMDTPSNHFFFYAVKEADDIRVTSLINTSDKTIDIVADGRSMRDHRILALSQF